MNTVFTAGYSGHTLEQLKQAAIALNAVVFDIRCSRRSAMWQWNEDNLFRVLGTDGYRPLPDWGNLNYKSGPVALAHPARGLWKALRELNQRSIILLCGRRSTPPATVHIARRFSQSAVWKQKNWSGLLRPLPPARFGASAFGSPGPR